LRFHFSTKSFGHCNGIFLTGLPSLSSQAFQRSRINIVHTKRHFFRQHRFRPLEPGSCISSPASAWSALNPHQLVEYRQQQLRHNSIIRLGDFMRRAGKGGPIDTPATEII